MITYGAISDDTVFKLSIVCFSAPLNHCQQSRHCTTLVFVKYEPTGISIYISLYIHIFIVYVPGATLLEPCVYLIFSIYDYFNSNALTIVQNSAKSTLKSRHFLNKMPVNWLSHFS